MKIYTYTYKTESSEWATYTYLRPRTGMEIAMEGIEAHTGSYEDYAEEYRDEVDEFLKGFKILQDEGYVNRAFDYEMEVGELEPTVYVVNYYQKANGGIDRHVDTRVFSSLDDAEKAVSKDSDDWDSAEIASTEIE